MLELEHYSTGYPSRPLATDLTCSFAPGTLTCILGPNGCGKSTLLASILGAVPARGGRVLADGRDFSTLTHKERARYCAYVAQASAPPAGFTLMDYVLLGRSAYAGWFSQPGAHDEAAARAALATVGLGDRADGACTRLSGGEWQLAACARALAQEPSYLLLDEPCASLDVSNQAKLLGHLASLAARGLGIVMTTHDPAHALALDAQALVLFSDGSWRYGAAKQLLASDEISRLYGCRIYVGQIEGAPAGVWAAGTVPEGRAV
jgi:iron complex transport system ATP-binding protein